jgi:hypothetical protein
VHDPDMLTYADVCCRMLTYADVRWVDGVHDPDKWDYIVANVGHHAAAGTIIS